MLSVVATNLHILSLMFFHHNIESEKQVQIRRCGTFGCAPLIPLQAQLEESLKALIRIADIPSMLAAIQSFL